MKKIELILEENDGLIWGYVESKGWMPTPYGVTINEVIENLKMLIDDYVSHEGKDDEVWNKTDWSKVNFDFKWETATT